MHCLQSPAGPATLTGMIYVLGVPADHLPLALRLGVEETTSNAGYTHAKVPAPVLLGSTAAAAVMGWLLWPAIQLRAWPGRYMLTLVAQDDVTQAYLEQQKVSASVLT